jgi:hypothetical protein
MAEAGVDPCGGAGTCHVAAPPAQAAARVARRNEEGAVAEGGTGGVGASSLALH